MAINLKKTGSIHTNGVKVLVYGHAGAGKTSLCATLPNPIVISAEAGLLSLQHADIPYIEVKSMDDLKEVYQWVTESDEGRKFDSVRWIVSQRLARLY